MTGRELLVQYIGSDRGARAAFARKANVSEAQLSLYLSGRRGLSIPVARRISEATESNVPVKSLVSEEVAELLGERECA